MFLQDGWPSRHRAPARACRRGGRQGPLGAGRSSGRPGPAYKGQGGRGALRANKLVDGENQGHGPGSHLPPRVARIQAGMGQAANMGRRARG